MKYDEIEKIKRKKGIFGIFLPGEFSPQESNNIVNDFVNKLKENYPDIKTSYQQDEDNRILNAKIDSSSFKAEISYEPSGKIGGMPYSSYLTTRAIVNPENSRELSRLIKKL